MRIKLVEFGGQLEGEWYNVKLPCTMLLLHALDVGIEAIFARDLVRTRKVVDALEIPKATEDGWFYVG